VAGILLGVKAQPGQRQSQVVEEEKPCERPLAIVEAKEWVRATANSGAEEAESVVRTFDPADFGNDERGAETERVGLRGREEQNGVVLIPGDRGNL
jgi:hypothetical protein